MAVCFLGREKGQTAGRTTCDEKRRDAKGTKEHQPYDEILLRVEATKWLPLSLLFCRGWIQTLNPVHHLELML